MLDKIYFTSFFNGYIILYPFKKLIIYKIYVYNKMYILILYIYIFVYEEKIHIVYS